MGSYAYILAAAFVLSGSLLLLSSRSDANRAEVDLGRIQMKQEARDAAVTGLNVTIRKLAEDQNPWLVASNYEAGPYSYGDRNAQYQTVVTIVDTIGGDTLDVVSTGTKAYNTRFGSGSDTTHVIQTRIARGLIVSSIPPGFRNAILADQQLLVHGDFAVSALLNGVNADIHTNGDLRARGKSFTIDGYGTYVGTEYLVADQEVLFTPPNDWNGSAGNIFQRDSIPLPDWDEAAFSTDAQSSGYFSSSSLYLDGEVLAAAGVTNAAELAVYLGIDPAVVAANSIGSTADSPLKIMIDDGSGTAGVTFDNTVTLGGYVQFGTTGEISILTHGPDDGLFMDYTLDQSAGLAETHAGLYTTSAIRVEGNATIIGTMYSEGSITYLGGTHLIGGQVAYVTEFQGGGTTNIEWVGPGPGILDYFDPYDEPVGPVIIAYAEW